MVFESISLVFILLRGNLLEFLQGDSGAYKSPINSGKTNLDEPVGLQGVEQLIEKPVWALLNQLNKVVHIFKVEVMRAALSQWSKLVLYNVASSNPESMDVFKHSF